MSTDFSVVLAVDDHHARELAAVWPTWVYFHPQITEVPIRVYVDEQWITKDRLIWLDELLYPRFEVVFVPWSHPQSETQREKMLSAFVLDAPFMVQTPYWVKIDTDCLATGPGPILRPEWLDSEPALISQKWSYTKCASTLAALDKWADLKKLPGRGPSRKIRGNRAIHPRIISYVCGINTEWSKAVARLCGDRMPVPSQDTLHHYVAVRRGDLVRTVDMKAAGWRHVGSGRIEKLERLANEAMAEGVVHA